MASLAWVARQVRPTLSYKVSKLQTVAGKATGKDVKEANEVLQYALETSTEGIYFKPNVFTWDNMVMGTIADASFANDKVLVGDDYEGDRSQQGYINALCEPDIINAQEAVTHPISWSSTTIVRACRSTLMAETFSMIKGTEAGTRLRAAVVDCMGKLDFKNWE